MFRPKKTSKDIWLKVVYAQKWPSCSAYAVAACCNILWMNIDPANLRDEVLKWPARAWSRWTIAALRYMNKKWVCWFNRISTLGEIISSIDLGNPIILETRNINFEQVQDSKDKIVVYDWRSYPWHVRHIIWYDNSKNLLKCRNSRWVNRWDKWNFYIRYEDLDALPQMYSVTKFTWNQK